jgi:aspartokinase
VEFDPPIHTRTTNELIAIANYTEDWNEEAIEQAKAELVKRGITKEEQEKKVNEWNEIAEKE